MKGKIKILFIDDIETQEERTGNEILQEALSHEYDALHVDSDTLKYDDIVDSFSYFLENVTQNNVDNDDFISKLHPILNEISEMLINKNRKYGNSALEPVRVFSDASPKEQILVRIDDKLSRIQNQQIDEDEDAIDDLIGYLILLKMVK